jgi:tetratricopeptide (TPR) repeat protein
LTRFEGPGSIAITPSAPAHVVRELDRLIARLRTEAGVNIRRISEGNANIYVETIPKKQLQSMIPTAACFVVPNVSGWADYRRNRFKNTVDWTQLESREKITVFMPNDIAPQESRDCLHEEIAQALGPVNDLYRLPDSVYNDDNFNIALTSYDMLILKAYYSPEIRNGMSKSQVASILPGLLARLNPVGQALPAAHLQQTSKDWVRAIETTLGPNASSAKRRSAAFRAVRIAKTKGYNDHRLGFAYFARAQISMRNDPRLAASDFGQAYSIFRTLFGPSDIHTAQAAVQMASLAISSGKYDDALGYLNDSIPAARKSQNGSLLFSLLAMKSEVYDGLGRYADAQTLKQEAISWAYYGLGSRSEVSRRLEQVAALRPRISTKGFY